MIMCCSAASLHLHLLNVSHGVYDSMQTHAIPYSFFGSVVCISRSREHNCPSYVLLGRKMIIPYSNTQADIREFESNNCLECCHEVRSGRQNVHAMQAWKNNKLVSESANCPAFKSADSFVQVCNLVHDFLSPSLITQV